MQPHNFDMANTLYIAPKDWDHEKDGACNPVPVWRFGRAHCSWRVAARGVAGCGCDRGMDMNDNKPRRLLSFGELKDKHGIPFTRRHLLNLENDKKFPARVPIGEHRVGWVESEIADWVDAKIKSRAA
jgi:prophage regulatory protein